MILKQLVETAARSRAYLNADARRTTIRFVRSCWNRDGGVRDGNGKSDLYYTGFAAMCMRAVRGRMPLLRLWKYVRSFGDGASLDLMQLFCLIRLRSIYPMSIRTRNQLMDSLGDKPAESPSDMFFKVVMAEYLKRDDRPDAELGISDAATTSDIAAAMVVNQRPNEQAKRLLMQRCCKTGGFRETKESETPDLCSTATALFALRVVGMDLAPLRHEGLRFIDSLRHSTGGYSCRSLDDPADTECTFYALFGIGCLMD